MPHKISLKEVRKAAAILLLSSMFSACSTLQPADCHVVPPHPPLVIFGDSYSDTGNIAIKGTIDMPDPPFFQNRRFSNGRVAVEWLADHLTTVADKPSLHTISCTAGYNFAVGGGNIRGLKVQDLECQVNDYLDMVNNTPDPTALFVVMMGGNDIRSLKNDLDAADSGKDIDQILDQLFEQLGRLATAGATKFLIANSGDMARLPGTIALNDPVIENRLAMYSDTYNMRFDTSLTEFATTFTGATVTKFDLFAVMNDIIDNPVHGFTNTTEACFDIDADPLYHADCAPPNILSPPEIDKFVFLDSVHASGKSQKLIGEAMKLALP